jgi:serine/threonine protein kinase
MKTQYACPFCKSDFEWDDDNTETVFSCPSCGNKMSAPCPSFKKGSRVGDYIIDKRIGLGGMGEVYTAEQVAMRRTVALKILQRELSSDKTYLDRFFLEVRTLAQIEHPNIVRAIEAGVDGSTYFLAMNFVAGSDIKHLLDGGKRFSEAESLRIALDVAIALKYVWDKHKLLHRDIKPANIMLTPDNEIKLMDLGISKKMHGEDSEITMAGIMVGSPQYISPEQAKAEKTIDFRADMYSLGASLFHIISGKTPYPGESGMTVVAHHLSSPIPDPRQIRGDISKRTAEMIMKMMAKKKEDRFVSWDKFIAEIKTIITEPSNSKEKKIAQKITRNTSPRKSPQSQSIFSSNPLYLAIFAILFATVFLGSYYIVRKSIEEAKEEKSKKLFQKAMNFYSKNTEPKDFREAVSLFEKVRKTGILKYQKAAKEEIDKIIKRAVAIKQEAQAEKVRLTLDDLKKKSYQYELERKWDSAILMWQTYKKEGQFAKEIGKDILRAIDYLERKKTEEENE